MTTNPTDAQMKLARECAATAVIEPSMRSKTDILKGYCDNWHGVQSALLAIQATEARAQGLVDALGEELFVLSDKLRATDWLQDDMNHHLYERVVSAFQALSTWRLT